MRKAPVACIMRKHTCPQYCELAANWARRCKRLPADGECAERALQAQAREQSNGDGNVPRPAVSLLRMTANATAG